MTSWHPANSTRERSHAITESIMVASARRDEIEEDDNADKQQQEKQQQEKQRQEKQQQQQQSARLEYLKSRDLERDLLELTQLVEAELKAPSENSATTLERHFAELLQCCKEAMDAFEKIGIPSYQLEDFITSVVLQRKEALRQLSKLEEDKSVVPSLQKSPQHNPMTQDAGVSDSASAFARKSTKLSIFSRTDKPEREKSLKKPFFRHLASSSADD